MAAPSPIVCPEKQKLLRAFAAAVSEHNRMQSAQIAALMRGDGSQFQSEINEAAARRENAKCAIMLHQQEHGCGPLGPSAPDE